MPSKLPTPARLEAFSDGVIAVIITIMVLELKVPHENGFSGLHAILPILLVYALSFTFTASYWVNHHHLADRIEHADHRILYANLFFLFFLSLLPFFTCWTLEKNLDSFSVALYAVSLIMTGMAFFVLRLVIDRRLSDQGTAAPENTAERHKHIASLVLYLVAIPPRLLPPPCRAHRSGPGYPYLDCPPGSAHSEALLQIGPGLRTFPPNLDASHR